MIHTGLDTVQLEGSGFEILAHKGAKVDAGAALAQIDLKYLEQNKK